MATLTAANAVIMFSIAGLFDSPVQLEGFAADDVFDTDAVQSAEVLMGVDGKLSGGFVFAPIPQNYALQADSPSVVLFDTWYASQVAQRDTFVATAVITLSNLGQKWAMTRGFLTSYPPTPPAKKILQPRRFTVIWERVVQAPT